MKPKVELITSSVPTRRSGIISVEGHKTGAVLVNVHEGEDDVGAQKGVDVLRQKFTNPLTVLGKAAVVAEYFLLGIYKDTNDGQCQRQCECIFIQRVPWLRVPYNGVGYHGRRN